MVPSRNGPAHSPAVAVLSVLLMVAWAGGPLLGAEADLGAGLRAAEDLEMGADRAGALKKYREALEALAARPVAERGPASWQGEVELALSRLNEIAGAAAAYRSARPVFERWMDAEVAGEPNLAALARFYAGTSALCSGGGPAEARRIWGPLGFLSRWLVVGPFDNERGGGFSAEYGPESDLHESAAGGKLFRPDPARPYPGKVRPVSWRKLPAEPIDGRVDLDELFRPNDEALAYALTYLESDAEQPAALRLGSDEGFKLWVNGTLTASRDVRRPLRFDQEAAGIRLRKGWNSILIKVTEAKGDWEFLARLTRPDGTALPGVREGEPPPDAPSAPPAESSEPVACSLGARDVLKKELDGSGADDRLHYLLGALLLAVRAHDDGEHPDRELLRQAIALRHGPVPAVYHYTLAESCERPTAIAAERDDNEWREALEASLADAPPSLRAALDLAGYSLSTFGNVSRAEKLLEKVQEARPGLSEAALLRGRIEERRGFPLARARTDAACAAALGVSGGEGDPALPEAVDPEAVRRTAGRLRGEGKTAAAGRLLSALLERNRFDQAARRLLTEIELSRGATDGALRLLAEREELGPFEVAARADRARILLGLDRPEEALAAGEEALRIAPEDHELIRKEGQALWRLGKKEEAFRVWERALSIQPNFPELRQYVEFARKSRDEFAERYRQDASKDIAAALERPPAGDDPLEVLLDLTAVRVNRDGTAKEFRQYVARAVNDRGIRLLDRYSTSYSQGEQRVEFKAARVHHKGGKVDEARLSVQGGAGGEGWTSASIDIPPLAVGDVAEVQHVTEDLRQSFFGDYFGRRERLGSDHPTAQRTFVLEAPADRKLYFHQRNLDLSPVVTRDDAAGTVTYTWTLRNVEALKPEPGMPPHEEVEPVVDASTFATWDDFARWYWNLIRHQLELSPAISAKVSELVSGKQGDLEKIRAVYDFVTGEVRYNAWEFGVHGFKPYNAATIFARRFGDCKDKATLLCTMLGAAGIRSHPVLIHASQARGDEDLTMPMVDHFNHCIAYVPPANGRPALFLDGTAERHAVDELPAMDRGARVLLVREGAGELAQVPWNRPEEVGSEEEVQTAIEPDRTARLTVRGRVRGDYAASLRSFFEVPGRRRVELEKIFGSRFAGASLESEKFSNLADREKPVEFELAVRVPDFLKKTPEGEVLPALDDFFQTAGGIGGLGDLEERHHDLVLGAPRLSRLRVVYLLPVGYRVRSLPADSDISGRFGRLSVHYQKAVEGDRPSVVLTRVIETSAPRVARADYGEFRQLAAQVARLKEEKVVIERAP